MFGGPLPEQSEMGERRDDVGGRRCVLGSRGVSGRGLLQRRHSGGMWESRVCQYDGGRQLGAGSVQSGIELPPHGGTSARSDVVNSVDTGGEWRNVGHLCTVDRCWRPQFS